MGKRKPAKTTETTQATLPINIEGTTLDLPISQLCRHPDNREPSESSIDEISASLASHGLLEPLTVRQIGENLYEIISGETRSLAAKKLGWSTIRCKVIEADDAKALQLVAIANGLREDLNPIQQAKLIERLCADVATGGGGMTRADAALAVGLESASAASNLVGLLRLPPHWQNRIASGKLPSTFGRAMIPACEVPAVLAELDEEWEEFESIPDDKEHERDYNAFGSRSLLEDSLEEYLLKHTRPCKAGDKHNYNIEGIGWEHRSQPMLFKMTPELEQKLEVKTIRIGGKDRLVATNVKAYDAIQVPLIQKKAKGKPAAANDDDGEKKPLTPAEQKAKAKLAAEKLAKRVEEWRYNWIRRIVASYLNGAFGDYSLGAELARFLAIYGAASLDRDMFREAVITLTPEKKRRSEFGSHSFHSVGLDDVMLVSPEDSEGTTVLVVAEAVAKSNRWPREAMEQSMRFLQQDLASHWSILQTDPNGKELLGEFYALFTTSQLDDLAADLKEPQVERVASKREKIEILLEGVYLKLPRVLKEIEQPKARRKGA